MIIDIEREKRTSFISSEWRSSEFGVWEKRQTLISRIDTKRKKGIIHRRDAKDAEKRKRKIKPRKYTENY
jgi:hypothetical protein